MDPVMVKPRKQMKMAISVILAKYGNPVPMGVSFLIPEAPSTACAKACVYDHDSCAFQIVHENEANIPCFQGTPCTKSQEQGLGLGPPRKRWMFIIVLK